MKILNYHKFDSYLFGIDDALAAGLVAGGVSALGSTVSNLFNRHSQKDANRQNQANWEAEMALNKEQFASAQNFNANQNELSRLFQKSEREAQQKFQQQMIAEQNRYNSLSAQIARARVAGANVNALFGSSANVASASPAGVPSGSSPSSLGSPSPTSVGGLPNIAPIPALFDARESAEISNILADTALKKSSSRYQDAMRVTEEALRAGKVEKQNTEILWTLKDMDVKDSTIRNIDQQTNKIDIEMDLLRQEFENAKKEFELLQQQVDIGEIDKKYYEQIVIEELNKLKSESAVNFAKVDLLAEQLVTAVLENGTLALEFEYQNSIHQNMMAIGKNITDKMVFDTGKDLSGKELLYYLEKGAGAVRTMRSALVGMSNKLRTAGYARGFNH